MAVYETIAAAYAALHEAEEDIRIDQGPEIVEAGWSDIVRMIGMDCSPAVRRELYRRQGVDELL